MGSLILPKDELIKKTLTNTVIPTQAENQGCYRKCETVLVGLESLKLI